MERFSKSNKNIVLSILLKHHPIKLHTLYQWTVENEAFPDIDIDQLVCILKYLVYKDIIYIDGINFDLLNQYKGDPEFAIKLFFSEHNDCKVFIYNHLYTMWKRFKLRP
jgi:hypothetical protein